MQALLQLKAAVAAFVAMAFVVPFVAVVQYKQTQKTCMWFNVEYFKSVVEYFKSPEYFPL